MRPTVHTCVNEHLKPPPLGATPAGPVFTNRRASNLAARAWCQLTRWLATRSTVSAGGSRGSAVPQLQWPCQPMYGGEVKIPCHQQVMLAAHSCHWFAGRLLRQLNPPASETSTQTTRTTVTAQTNIIIDAALLAKWQPGIPLPRQIGQGASCQLLPLETACAASCCIHRSKAPQTPQNNTL